MTTQLELNLGLTKVFALYLGQEIVCTNDKYIGGKYTGILAGSRFDELFIDNGKGDGYDPISDCKLVLRTLEQMTDEEAIVIAKLALQHILNFAWFKYAINFGSNPKNEPQLEVAAREIFDTDKDGTEHWTIRVDIPETDIFVNIWDDFNVDVINNKNDTQTGNQSQIFSYLLKQGFAVPLFELQGKTPIEYGIAIKKEN